MKNLTIYRDSWARGTGAIESRLLRENGQMCCLGFLALACGYSREYIEGVSTPASLLRDVPDLDNLWPDGTLTTASHSTPTINQMMRTNDAREMPAPLRELLLRKLFADIGYAVEFVDGEMPT